MSSAILQTMLWTILAIFMLQAASDLFFVSAAGTKSKTRGSLSKTESFTQSGVTPSTRTMRSLTSSEPEVTRSPSISASLTATISGLTASSEVSASLTPSSTFSVTSSQSRSWNSQSPSGTESKSLSDSAVSPTLSQTKATPTPSPSEFLTASFTPTITPPPTPSSTPQPTPSPTAGFASGTITLMLTPTKKSSTLSVSVTPSGTISPSPSADVSPTFLSKSPTSSLSGSPTISPSLNVTETATSLRTVSIILTPTPTHVVSGSEYTASLSQHVSMSTSLTVTVRLTPSDKPPTTTHVPTPTQTLLTKCPPCGNGTCTDRPPYVCQCFLSFKLGFWSGGEVQGATCIECLANFYGRGCRNACPGGICTPCSNHGRCLDGVSGNGTCVCHFNASVGFWTGDKCDTCAPGYFGPRCQGVCGCDPSQGTCREGVSGNGTCVCVTGRAGDQCTECAPGYYLTSNNSCILCPGTRGGQACNGHGACDPSNGQCYCTGEFTSASNCAVEVSGTVNGCVPPCTNGGVCTFGRCVCPSGFVGPSCQAVCPRGPLNSSALELSVCSGRGECLYVNSTSARCSCFAGNASFGFWSAASNCSDCVDGYGSDRCATQCPANAAGDICSFNAVRLSFPTATLSQLCNKTTATCSCPSTFCGDNCSTSGLQCATPCLSPNTFGLGCIYTCVNGTTFPFQNASGRCECNPGYVGLQCDVPCSCSSNASGVCPYGNNTCVCRKDFAGVTCSRRCPQFNGITCSGHGICDDGALGQGGCRCTSGYVGEACNITCRCVNLTLGSCNSTGGCQCAKSTWRVGDDCGSCQSGRAGFNCRTQCVNGVTSGTRCMCYPTFGDPGCSTQCPSLGGLLCGGHGHCDDQDTGTGRCMCNESFVGPSCNCSSSVCAASQANSQCDVATGQCVCVLPFGGPRCTDCADGYWGVTCTDVCTCLHGSCDRLRGTCNCFADQVRGFWDGAKCAVCKSGYNLPDCVQLSSSSTLLPSMQSVFQSGKAFFLSKSLLLVESLDVAIVLGPIVTLYLNISQEISVVSRQLPISRLAPSAVSSCVLSHGWIGNRSFEPTVSSVSNESVVCQTIGNNCTNTTGAPPALVGNLSLFILFTCGTAATVVTNVIEEFPILPLPYLLSDAQIASQVQTVNTFNFTIPRLVSVVLAHHFVHDGSDFVAIASTIDFDYSGTAVNSFYSVNFDRLLRHTSRELTPASMSDNLEAVVTYMNAILYDAGHRELILVGSFDVATAGSGAQTNRAGVYLLSFPPGRSGQMTVLRQLSSYQSVSYAAVISTFCGSSTKSESIIMSSSDPRCAYVVLQVTNGTQDFIRINISAGQTTYPVSFASTTVLTPSDAIATTQYDPLSGTLVAVANNGVTFKLIRLELCSLLYMTTDGAGMRMIGSQLLPAVAGQARNIISSQASLITRQLFLLQLNSTGTLIRRFLMYENVAVFPTAASRFSGPRITITGRGFVTGLNTSMFPFNVPRCRVTSGSVRYETPATILNATTATCVLDVSNSSLCTADVIEVAIFASYYTTNQLSIPRFQDPQLVSVTPSSIRYSSVLPSILVNGTNFLSTGTLLCRWTPTSSRHSDVEVNDTAGVFLSTRAVLCRPPEIRRAITLYVNIALDGTVFTTQYSSATMLRLLGDPHNITSLVQLFKLESAAVVSLETTVISFVDIEGSPLLDTVSERIQLEVIPEGLVLTGTTQQANNVGVFTVSGLHALSPNVSGALTAILFRATPLFDTGGSVVLWSTRVPVTVQSGKPDHLFLTTAPSQDVGVPETNTIPAIEVTVEDIAGNRITTINSSYAANVSLMMRLADGISVPPELLLLYPAAEMPNKTIRFESGLVSFANIFVSNARGGMIFWFEISTNVTRGVVPLSIRTKELIPKCNAGKVRFIGDPSCRVCPPNMQCPNAQELAADYGNTSLLVQVSPGYWRSSVYADQAIACSPEFACVGGTLSGRCADGYDGTLCGLCAAGYGRSIIGGDCVECMDSRAGVFCLILVVFCMMSLLIFLTIAAAQNWAVTLEPVISVVMLVTHLQSVLGVGLNGFPFSQFFNDVMSYIGIFSTRVLDYYFSDCVLTVEGMTFYHKVTAFAATPGAALMVASISWLVVFLVPTFLKHKKSHDARHFALTVRRDEIMRRLTRNAGRGTASRLSRNERMRRLADQAELACVEDDLKRNLKAQGVLPLQDYRLLALHAMQVVMFFTFHTVVYYCLTVFDCQEVNTGLGTEEAFLQTDNRIRCNSDQYVRYRAFGYFVSIAFFILVPVGFVAMYKTHRQLRPTRVMQRRQLFYPWCMGVKTGSWYWPAVVMLRKGLQFAVAAAAPSPADAQIATWLFAAQLIWLLNLKPYWNHSNTQLEALSLVSLLVGSCMCILFAAYTTDYDQVWISGAVLAVLLAPVPVFMISATQKVWQSVREEIRAMRIDSGTDESTESEEEPAKPVIADPLLLRGEAQVAPLKRPTAPPSASPSAVQNTSAATSASNLRKLSLAEILRREEDLAMAQEAERIRREGDPTTAQRRKLLARGEPTARPPRFVHGSESEDDELESMRSSSEEQHESDWSGSDLGDDEARGNISRKRSRRIPALVPLSLRPSMISRSGRVGSSSDDEYNLDAEEYDPRVSQLTHAQLRARAERMLDETSKQVFRDQLRHDEATRREHAFEDLMAMEEEYQEVLL